MKLTNKTCNLATVCVRDARAALGYLSFGNLADLLIDNGVAESVEHAYRILNALGITRENHPRYADLMAETF